MDYDESWYSSLYYSRYKYLNTSNGHMTFYGYTISYTNWHRTYQFPENYVCNKNSDVMDKWNTPLWCRLKLAFFFFLFSIVSLLPSWSQWSPVCVVRDIACSWGRAQCGKLHALLLDTRWIVHWWVIDWIEKPHPQGTDTAMTDLQSHCLVLALLLRSHRLEIWAWD